MWAGWEYFFNFDPYDAADANIDSDGDGWGDNQTAGAYKLDHWPNDPANLHSMAQCASHRADARCHAPLIASRAD